ncbi:MAG: [NiFe]-hydrogenase assembly chaperone HybE [Candidatus Thiodiazotropha sp. (ex Monitilora ramsayi)]|nr:[NiFe]-hydrogenase assembly chaperone HybE [Candidatus Thiodiazotropha sp. (ex Monitilora ramsayi)]
MICPEYLTEGLESHFMRIGHDRMQGLPLLNPALQVQAVGFQVWQDYCVGVLITPWFMNLMLLPNEGDDWQDRGIGDKQLHQFPSGPYEFIIGEEPGIGRYQMCSLFSPVFEFADQETAVATAEAVMTALMDEENRDDISTHEAEIQRRWYGEDETENDTSDAVPDEAEAVGLSDRLEQPLSRRDLLRGRLSQDAEP